MVPSPDSLIWLFKTEATKLNLLCTRGLSSATGNMADYVRSLPTSTHLSETFSKCAPPASVPLRRASEMSNVCDGNRFWSPIISEHRTLTAHAVGLVENQRAFSLVSLKPRGANRTLPATRPFLILASLTSVQSNACTPNAGFSDL